VRQADTEGDSELLQSVLTFYDRFAQQNATNSRLQSEAAWAYRRVGALYDRLGKDSEAEKANTRAIAIFEELVSQFPSVREYRSNLVDTYIMADPWSADHSSLERLKQRLTRAQVLVDQLAAEAPENLDYIQAQVHVYAKLGAVLQRLTQDSAAEACYRRAIALGESLIERSPRPTRARIDRSDIRETLAEFQLGRGRRDEAKELFDASAAELESLAAARSRSLPMADRFDALAAAFELLGEPDRARELTCRADDLRSRPMPGPPGPPGCGGRPRRPGN
jgi:tetratricopeptide (TPR) repeat protein